MSPAKRYACPLSWLAEDRQRFIGETEVVRASDYDALAARLAEAERLLEQWRHSFEYTSDAHASGRAACLATDATRKYFGMRPWMDWVAISGRKSYEQRPTASAPSAPPEST